jgi:hypothetical protein
MEKNSTGNNCCVLGDGSKAEDHAHVSMATPLETKRKELANDPMYRTKQENGLDPKRETATREARIGGNVRPLDGGVARK